MKTVTIIGLTLSGGLFACASLSAADTNGLALKLRDATASGNIAVVSAALPDIEALWPADSQTYFGCMRAAAGLLAGAASTNPDARRTLIAAYTNALSKPCPADEQEAVACLESKQEIALVGDYTVGESHQKSPLLDLARFVGEIRSRTILNYTNRGRAVPEGLQRILSQAHTFNAETIKDPALKKECENLVEQNRRNIATDQFQMLLVMTDRSMSRWLLQHLSRFSSQDRENSEFIRDVTAAARLTQEEQEKLHWNR